MSDIDYSLTSTRKIYKLLKKNNIIIDGYNHRYLYFEKKLSIDSYVLKEYTDTEILDYVKNKILNFNINKRLQNQDDIKEVEQKTYLTIDERKKNIRKNLENK